MNNEIHIIVIDHSRTFRFPNFGMRMRDVRVNKKFVVVRARDGRIGSLKPRPE